MRIAGCGGRRVGLPVRDMGGFPASLRCLTTGHLVVGVDPGGGDFGKDARLEPRASHSWLIWRRF